MASKKRKLTKSVAIADLKPGVIKDTITDVINVDTDGIGRAKNNITAGYSSISTAAGKIVKEINADLDAKNYAGKPKELIKKVKDYATNQKKFAESRAEALTKQIENDTKEMDVVVSSMKQLNEIDAIIAGSTDASVIALAGITKSYVTQPLADAGYTVNTDGTVTKGGVTYDVDTTNGKIVKHDPKVPKTTDPATK